MSSVSVNLYGQDCPRARAPQTERSGVCATLGVDKAAKMVYNENWVEHCESAAPPIVPPRPAPPTKEGARGAATQQAAGGIERGLHTRPDEGGARGATAAFLHNTAPCSAFWEWLPIVGTLLNRSLAKYRKI